MAVVGPKTVTALKEFLQHPEPPKPTVFWVEGQLGALSIKPKKNRNDSETRLMVEIYIPIMLEHSQPDLNYAVNQLMRKSKWFPEISEIVELATFSRGKRDSARNRAKALIMKHEREYFLPISESERCNPSDVAALLSNFLLGNAKEGCSVICPT